MPADARCPPEFAPGRCAGKYMGIAKVELFDPPALGGASRQSVDLGACSGGHLVIRREGVTLGELERPEIIAAREEVAQHPTPAFGPADKDDDEVARAGPSLTNLSELRGRALSEIVKTGPPWIAAGAV